MMMAVAGTIASGRAAPSTSTSNALTTSAVDLTSPIRHSAPAATAMATRLTTTTRRAPKARTIACVAGAVIRLPKPIGASNSPQTRTGRSRTYCRYCGNKNSTPTKAT